MLNPQFIDKQFIVIAAVTKYVVGTISAVSCMYRSLSCPWCVDVSSMHDCMFHTHWWLATEFRVIWTSWMAMKIGLTLAIDFMTASGGHCTRALSDKWHPLHRKKKTVGREARTERIKTNGPDHDKSCLADIYECQKIRRKESIKMSHNYLLLYLRFRCSARMIVRPQTLLSAHSSSVTIWKLALWIVSRVHYVALMCINYILR